MERVLLGMIGVKMRSVDHKNWSKRLEAYSRIKEAYRSEFHDFTREVEGVLIIPSIFTIHAKYGPIFCGIAIINEQDRCSVVGQETINVIAGVSQASSPFHILQFSAKHTGDIKNMKARFDWFDLSTRGVHPRNCLISVRNKSIYDKVFSFLGFRSAMSLHFAPAGSP